MSKNAQNLMTIGPYVLGNTLGAGVTGKVKLANDKETGEQFAIKMIKKTLFIQKPEMEHKIAREIAVMRVISHPHTLTMYDVYENDEYIFLVLEYAQKGELFDYLISKGPLDNNQALKIFQQILEGLDYLHRNFICHRDLKPENLLLDKNFNIKIADFGMASMKINDKLFETSCGSPHYASPEVVQGISYNGMKADIWSSGVILFALVTGKLPFDDENIRRLLSKVKSGVFVMPGYLPPDLQDLIKRMLTVDPVERISIEDIKKHPWYTSMNFLDPKLPPLPAHSPSAEKIDNISMENVKTLKNLGYGSEDEVLAALESDEPSLEKTFYAIIEQRRESSRKSATPLRKKKKRTLERVVSLKFRTRSIGWPSSPLIESTDAKSINNNNNNNNSEVKNESETAEPKMMRRYSSIKMLPNFLKRNDLGKTDEFSMYPSKYIRIKFDEQEDFEKPVINPKANWLSQKFSQSEMNLRMKRRTQLKEGVHIQRKLGDITNQLEDVLDTIGASYYFSRKRDRLMVRVTKEEHNTIKICIRVLRGMESSDTLIPSHFVSFSRRGGNRKYYKEIVNSIKSLLTNNPSEK